MERKSGMANTSVEVICYGKSKIWSNRKDAIAFYHQGILECDGSERDRYLSVYMDLIFGKAVCTDNH